MATTGNHPVNDPTKEDAPPEMQKIKYLVFDHNNIRYHVRNEALWWPGKLFMKRRQESAADPDFGRPRRGGRTDRNTNHNTPWTEFIVPGATGSPSSFSDSGDKDENIHVRKARSEARQVIRLAKRKRNEDDEDDDDDDDVHDDKAAADDSQDDDVDTFYDAQTGLTDDEDEYMTAVEEQPAVWPILRRRRRKAGGRKKKVKIIA